VNGKDITGSRKANNRKFEGMGAIKKERSVRVTKSDLPNYHTYHLLRVLQRGHLLFHPLGIRTKVRQATTSHALA
jgi:hypothetical protein